MLARAKARAIAICARSLAEVLQTREDILAISPETVVVVAKADVSNEKDMDVFFDTIKTQVGRMDIAISNAGANSCFQNIENTNTEEWWHDFVKS